jgi:hypothetical protein
VGRVEGIKDTRETKWKDERTKNRERNYLQKAERKRVREKKSKLKRKREEKAEILQGVYSIPEYLNKAETEALK